MPMPDAPQPTLEEVPAEDVPAETGLAQREFPCPSCGANLNFDPATGHLQCTHCGQHSEISRSNEPIHELDFHAHLAKLQNNASRQETLVIHCSSCGARTTLSDNVTSSRCPFCDSPIVVQAQSVRQLQPKSLLPFRISIDQARKAYEKWLHGLWFAPSNLKKMASIEERLRGLYIPFWTYDSKTYSTYTGMRGDDYYVTQTYTTMVNGKPTTRTRQVRKTRWRHVSGSVRVNFDDVLVLASHSLPAKLTDALEPWDLRQLAPAQDEYLAGFTAESYQIDLPAGFGIAQGKMDPVIRSAVRRDIGGDHQRITTLDTRYSDITFKHLLLPIWLASYRYHQKVYRFLVNARTGEVQGQRPWSIWKITLFVLMLLIIAGSIALAFNR